MGKEIEILLEAHRQGCLIVDKDSHVLLEQENLDEATNEGRYQDEAILSGESSVEVSGPFPGCPQFGAAQKDEVDFRVLGQTQHFVIFFATTGPVPRLGTMPF